MNRIKITEQHFATHLRLLRSNFRFFLLIRRVIKHFVNLLSAYFC